MGPFFTKDFLIYWRDRKEMLVSLVTPLILIAVLGLALPDWIENRSESLQMSVALVNEDDEKAGLQQFRETLGTQSLPEESTASLVEGAEQLSPTALLKQMFQNEEIEEFVKMVELDAETALKRLNDEEVVAIITIPDGFAHAALNKMLLDEGNGAALELTADEASLKVDVLQDLLDGFVQHLNFQSAISYALGSEAAALPREEQAAGGLEKVAGVEMLTSFQYFAVAISILFALFVSQTTATKATAEKREHVFERILLTGSHPLKYLAGKTASTFCMSLLLLSIILLASHLIFNIFPDRSLSFWFGMTVITVVFSLCVAALAALFTSLIFRMNDEIANGLLFLIILVIGSIGGSFVPIFALPDWLKEIGEWTPNGLSLSVFIQWIQYESSADLFAPLLKLVLFAVMTIAAGMWIFPKRGRI